MAKSIATIHLGNSSFAAIYLIRKIITDQPNQLLHQAQVQF
jgi:hypothetical protein